MIYDKNDDVRKIIFIGDKSNIIFYDIDKLEYITNYILIKQSRYVEIYSYIP